MKKTSGFTLVELIVVIAILAILAGIAIPVYSGYIAKANEANDLQLLDSVKTAAVFAAVDADPDTVVEKIEFTFGETQVTINDETDPISIDEYVDDTASKGGNTSATWTVADGWVLN